MALTENGTDTTMLVTPANGIAYGGNYGGGGLFGGGDSWLGILFLIGYIVGSLDVQIAIHDIHLNILFIIARKFDIQIVVAVFLVNISLHDV